MRQKKIVMAFGTFDFLHAGHLYYLKKAKSFGDKLIVVVSRDKNAKRVKGTPAIHDERERLKLVKALRFVDLAVLGKRGKNFFEVLIKYKPDIIALGYDQEVDTHELEDFIKKHKLKSKIVKIKAYKPHLFKSSKIKKALYENTNSFILQLGKDIL
ncbi:MAG: adenylyltransferase/cytidyltransferase family protein [Candidatus Diapherotrites archaeon]